MRYNYIYIYNYINIYNIYHQSAPGALRLCPAAQSSGQLLLRQRGEGKVATEVLSPEALDRGYGKGACGRAVNICEPPKNNEIGI